MQTKYLLLIFACVVACFAVSLNSQRGACDNFMKALSAATPADSGKFSK